MRAPLWVIIGVGLLSAFNGLGALGVMAALPTLRDLPLGVPLVVLLGVPLLWSVVFALLCFGICVRWQHAWRFFAPLLSAYALSRLALALLAQSDYDQGRLGAQAALTVLFSGAVWWYAWRKRGLGKHR